MPLLLLLACVSVDGDPTYNVTQILREAPQLQAPRGDLQHSRIGYACQNARRRYCFGQRAHRYYVRTGFKNRIENWNQLTEGLFMSRNKL
jgi:hypothetical protein